MLVGQLAGCGQMQPVGSRSEMIDYQVKRGDTLFSIAWRYGYDHREVAAWNNIRPPYTIHPGQHIYIIPPYQKNARNGRPTSSSSSKTSPTRTASRTTSTRPAITRSTTTRSSTTKSQTKSSPSRTTASRTKVENRPVRHQNTTVRWNWPTDGKVMTRFSPSSGKKGVDIGGKTGQSIKAAADGKVVYSGKGLIGYGNLIIIKHNDTYLSAYGHNRRLLVKEGTSVKQGQKIAEMGESGKQGVMLHFEIRRQGKPVDPLRYLPKKGT